MEILGVQRAPILNFGSQARLPMLMVLRLMVFRLQQKLQAGR